MSEVTDGAIVLSGFHCDVEVTISQRDKIQLDFGYGEVETGSKGSSGDVKVYSNVYMHVEPGANVDRPERKSSISASRHGSANKICAACLLRHCPFALA